MGAAQTVAPRISRRRSDMRCSKDGWPPVAGRGSCRIDRFDGTHASPPTFSKDADQSLVHPGEEGRQVDEGRLRRARTGTCTHMDSAH